MDVGGVIAVNTTWGPTGNPPDTVYNLISDINIIDSVTLTIQPGVKVKSSGPRIRVVGRLVAIGTDTSRITFTSSQPVPAPQDWSGINFEYITLDSSVLDYCTIEYAVSGVAVTSPYTLLRIDHSQITRCYDGYCAGGRSVARGNQFSDNVHSGICIYESDSLGVEISNNVISNNPIGLELSDGPLPRFLVPNTFSNNGVGIKVEEFAIMDARTWDPAVGGTDCQVDGQIRVYPAGQLTIPAGNTFKFNTGSTGIYISGRLIALGTASSRIIFTSLQPVPAPMDWSGITFWVDALDSSVLDYCTIEYAGTGVTNLAAPLRIEYNDIKNNYCGIACQYFIPSLRIMNNRIFNNTLGITCMDGVLPIITNNSIYDNLYYGVINYDNNYWINAENNWWGDPTGPRDTSSVDTLYNPDGLGNPVSDHVDYEPWLGQPVGIKEDQTSPGNIPANAFIQASPNPFKNAIALAYSSDPSRPIRIKIFNCLGQLVAYLDNSCNKSSQRIIYWNGKDMRGNPVPAGVYWCQIENNKSIEIKKIIKVE